MDFAGWRRGRHLFRHWLLFSLPRFGALNSSLRNCILTFNALCVSGKLGGGNSNETHVFSDSGAMCCHCASRLSQFDSCRCRTAGNSRGECNGESRHAPCQAAATETGAAAQQFPDQLPPNERHSSLPDHVELSIDHGCSSWGITGRRGDLVPKSWKSLGPSPVCIHLLSAARGHASGSPYRPACHRR